MSLRELYAEKYGEEAEKTAAEGEEVITKEAADQALEKALDALSAEEAEKVAQVISVFDEEGLEFDHDLYKLAAAAEIVDEYDEYQEAEKQAAEEIEAAGRLMAHAMTDELAKIAGGDPEGEGEGEKTEGEEAEGEKKEDAPAEEGEKTSSLSEKLAAAVAKE